MSACACRNTFPGFTRCSKELDAVHEPWCSQSQLSPVIVSKTRHPMDVPEQVMIPGSDHIPTKLHLPSACPWHTNLFPGVLNNLLVPTTLNVVANIVVCMRLSLSCVYSCSFQVGHSGASSIGSQKFPAAFIISFNKYSSIQSPACPHIDRSGKFYDPRFHRWYFSGSCQLIRPIRHRTVGSGDAARILGVLRRGSRMFA